MRGGLAKERVKGDDPGALGFLARRLGSTSLDGGLGSVEVLTRLARELFLAVLFLVVLFLVVLFLVALFLADVPMRPGSSPVMLVTVFWLPPALEVP